ncbi:GH1 family beta-glucosidase [Pseudoruegeria sp. SHC-113]|uniref:GH1 family beta-glucosidase n=1 Tax=Pseudoruegeria sp. SHC-113 TaxID=2855439 RepID=UPI0021BA841D|nr:GH1 family beta-glucosidase [Pseudoruegeria sp. SHC-113]MCT8160900.1 beta-glucosidase [Pseudoruegeria sp. SHC-113]
MSLTIKRTDFPEGFLFGAATSSYQIEGHAFGGAGSTHWDTFAATPGNVARAENGARAVDHYHRYPEDIALMKDAGFDMYRFSTSWARVMPEGRGAVNAEGLDFYDRLTDAVLEAGLKPCATLYHWELPSALADLGGWTNRDIAHWLGDFAEVIMGRIGDRMHSVAPINEPWCVAWLSHFHGLHAPGLRDIRAAARAMHHVNFAHGTAIERLRAMGIKNLGCVFNAEYALPANESESSKRAAARYDAIFNRFFISGVFKGEYPELVLEGLEPHLPKGWQDDFATITAPLDWCGLNYYTRKLLRETDAPWPSYAEVPGPLPKTSIGWEIFPEGLHHFLKMFNDEYSKGLPIFVTENGTAGFDPIENGRVQDDHRISYIDKHLHQAALALSEGVPLQGYFLWSLLDNYEWAEGYDQRFGLIHVDYESLQRTPKASYEALKAALAA